MTDINTLYAQRQSEKQAWLIRHMDAMTEDERKEVTDCIIAILLYEWKISELYEVVKGRVAE